MSCMDKIQLLVDGNVMCHRKQGRNREDKERFKLVAMIFVSCL